MSVAFAQYSFYKFLTSKFNKETFENVTLQKLQTKEIRRMERAFTIKKQALEEDRKALKKYKYDP